MTKERIAIFQMLACATLWSMGGIFIKLIPWHGIVIAGLRSLVAGITIYVCMCIMDVKYVVNKKTLLAGLFSALTYICFVCANKLTTAANAIVLQFTSPVFIILYSAMLFKKPVRRQDLTVVCFTLVGIALFFLDQLAPGYILGNIMSIVAGMFMAGMFVSVGVLEEEQRFSGVLNGQIITFLACIPFIFTTRPEMTSVTVSSLLILGVFQLGIAYVFYVKSSRYCPPLACCLLGALEPLLSPIWVLIFVGEKPGVFALIGGIIVVVSITVWCIFGQEKPAQEKLAEV